MSGRITSRSQHTGNDPGGPTGRAMGVLRYSEATITMWRRKRKSEKPRGTPSEDTE